MMTEIGELAEQDDVSPSVVAGDEDTAVDVHQQLAPIDEIRDLIASSEGRLGDVYRLTEEGLDPDQIAEKLNVATSSFVYS